MIYESHIVNHIIFIIVNMSCYNYIYNDLNAIKIQSFYRGYRRRKYLNNVYKMLPQDVQYHIIYFIRQDYYIKKMNNKLNFFISNKINNYIITFNNILEIDINIPFTLLTYLSNNYKYIIHIHELYIKYQVILSKSIHFVLLVTLDKLSILLSDYENRLYNAYSNHHFEITYALYIRLIKLIR